MNTWEIEKFQEFLKDKEEIIVGKVNTDEAKRIINLVFSILRAELNYEFEKEDKLFSEKKA